MLARHLVFALGLCAIVTSPVNALLSLNVTQDNTTLPGWVINTFTVDSDTDLTCAVMYSHLTSGSMLNLPGYFPITQSNGTGDSYISINNDPSTSAWLGYGDLVGGQPTPFFDDNGIGMFWNNFSKTDIGTGMHLATLTFSEDTTGSLLFIIAAAGERTRHGSFDIDAGILSLVDSYIKEPTPQPDPGTNTDPDPDPDPNPNPNPNPNPYPDSNPIPEPAFLGVLGVAAAFVGGLGRKRFRN